MIVDELLIQEGVEKKMRTLTMASKVTRVNPNIPIQRYYRSLLEVHKSASESLRLGELKGAFVLLVRFCSMAIEELPKHPQNSSFKGEEKVLVTELLRSSFSKAEEIKASVKQILYREVVSEMEKAEVDDQSINQVSQPSTNYDRVLELPVNDSEKRCSLILAADIIEAFMTASTKNTLENIETCGFLCGRKMDNNYLISHVIIPPQVGTSDSCCAEDEMGLFNIQMENDLLTLGWIHTHPTQTAFLSSVDLHTHHGYQSAMELAIAIVVAPTQKIGTFTLTAEGMRIIGDCKERGFHTHPESSGPLFVEAQHVEYSTAHKIKICDLR